jgi:hypothetical protein
VVWVRRRKPVKQFLNGAFFVLPEWRPRSGYPEFAPGKDQPKVLPDDGRRHHGEPGKGSVFTVRLPSGVPEDATVGPTMRQTG